MNYLGHLVLSGLNEDILFGNFIADAIKGSSFKVWPEEIQSGILLHRYIDNFTDTHSLYLTSKRRFYSNYPKISGVITDILYDHLLICNWDKHVDICVDDFISRSYQILDKRKHQMPDKIRFMYRYMRRDNWLKNYKYEDGIRRALSGIGKRTGFGEHIHEVFEVFKVDPDIFLNEFDEFFLELSIRSKVFLRE